MKEETRRSFFVSIIILVIDHYYLIMSANILVIDHCLITNLVPINILVIDHYLTANVCSINILVIDQLLLTDSLHNNYNNNTNYCLCTIFNKVLIYFVLFFSLLSFFPNTCTVPFFTGATILLL